ncbi:MAG: DUF1266 domain-containing protein [Myxococcota bacterium]
MDWTSILVTVALLGVFLGWTALWLRRRLGLPRTVAQFLERTGYRLPDQRGVPVPQQVPAIVEMIGILDRSQTSMMGRTADVTFRLVRVHHGHDVWFRMSSDEQGDHAVWTARAHGTPVACFQVAHKDAPARFSQAISVGERRIDRRFQITTHAPASTLAFLRAHPEFLARLARLPYVDLFVRDGQVNLFDRRQANHRRVFRGRDDLPALGRAAFERAGKMRPLHNEVADLLTWLATQVVERDPARAFVLAAISVFANGEDPANWSPTEAVEFLDSGWNVKDPTSVTSTLGELERSASEAPEQVAWHCIRGMHVARLAVAAGFLEGAASWSWCLHLAGHVRRAHASWADVSVAFLRDHAHWARGPGQSPAAQQRKIESMQAIVHDRLAHDWVAVPFGG